ncbi:leucine-rich repeat-containing protein 69 [Notothenia coriiceps]|uniref:Protein Sur-8 homolog n=1 Tax=Notothenia coriiceps TaxID=8208 RepID=A0A6I9NUL9_9TELE|nr:PREDICTED: leucine-rich repeat-containing protein 69 [Notothenia coriiceps]
MPTAAPCSPLTKARSRLYVTGTRAWWWTLVAGLRLCPSTGLILLMWTFPGRWSWLCPHVGPSSNAPPPTPCREALTLVGAPGSGGPSSPTLTRLRHLSVLDNKLEEVPAELGHLTSLTEINFTSNNLPSLPMQLYQCKEITKLHVARNKLTSLPEGIKALTKLQVLDVAGNKLSMFPVEFDSLPLKELYHEDNRFVRCEPMSSVQDVEVLMLKELAARFVLQQDRDMSSLVHRMLPYYPPLPELLANGSCCALCLNPFLTTWLECVHFVSVNKETKIRSSKTIPVRAFLCSYKCFNTEGHSYYGVARK